MALTELTTPERSKAQFEQLCSLLGDSIIGNIWIYGSRDQYTVQVSVEAIPNIVRVLGIGTSRYLKVRIARVVDVARFGEAHDPTGLSAATGLSPRTRSRQ